MSRRCVLLAVGPYSQCDLSLLELIDEGLGSCYSRGVQVYVVNLLNYDSMEQLTSDFPGAGTAGQTPLAAARDAGSLNTAASGKEKARDLAPEKPAEPAFGAGVWD